MKIRTRFISNSSSTSFCIVGLEYSYLHRIFEKMGLNKSGPIYSGYGCFDISDDKLEGYGNEECRYLGFNAHKILKNNSLDEAIKEFVSYIKEKYNIDISPDRVDLRYGSAGD